MLLDDIGRAGIAEKAETCSNMCNTAASPTRTHKTRDAAMTATKTCDENLRLEPQERQVLYCSRARYGEMVRW